MSTGVTSKNYWDEYWGEGEIKHPNYDATQGVWHSYKLLLEDCFTRTRERLRKRHLRVIDYGSGEGLLLRFIVEQFDEVDVYGIEYSDAIFKAEKMAEELGHSFNLIHGDIFGDWDTGYFGKFDVVLSFGLIEHFEQPHEVLAKMMQVLKPGGTIVTVIPNFNGIFNALWRLYDRANYAYHIPIRHDRLVQLHVQCGLQEVSFHTLGGPTVPGVHNANSLLQQLIRSIAININGRILRKIYRQQSGLKANHPMTSTVACVGVKD